jgi:hypothetical protein
VIAETVPPGPRLAGWLSGQDPETASGRDLIGMAEGFRRVASWAQAGELALVAQVAARSAAADPRAGLAPDGRPALLTEDATAQVSLGLTLSHTGAEAWTGLAVALRWRLPRTAAALAEGQIDTYRAKILAEAVIPLSDDAAQAVEDRVIPLAGDLTYAQLHSAVRRAVIAADPEGAEHRRAAAERRTKVSLYPDQDGTATLVGARLPAAEAAAAFARVCAIANAMKAAGAGGGISCAPRSSSASAWPPFRPFRRRPADRPTLIRPPRTATTAGHPRTMGRRRLRRTARVPRTGPTTRTRPTAPAPRATQTPPSLRPVNHLAQPSRRPMPRPPLTRGLRCRRSPMLTCPRMTATVTSGRQWPMVTPTGILCAMILWMTTSRGRTRSGRGRPSRPPCPPPARGGPSACWT